MDEIFNFKKLYRAYLACREAKRKTINALRFEWGMERNLSALQKDLKMRTYKPGRSICFAVKEPSVREIFAAEFRDRVVHHLLINEIIGIGEKEFIFDSYACRKGKGTHAAARRLKEFCRKVTRNGARKAYYLQLDLSGFFMSIGHDVLYSLLEKAVERQNKSYQWKNSVLWLAGVVIFNKPTENYFAKGDLGLLARVPPRKSLFCAPPGLGLPIGNYSSQFFANLHLNQLDQFAKRVVGCRYYLRFVDDFIILAQSRKDLVIQRNLIIAFLQEELRLKINFGKQRIQPLDAGIDFLGYFIKPDYVLVRRKVVARFKNRVKEMEIPSNKEATQKALAVLNSYYGHFRHAFSFNLRKDVYENHLGSLKEKFLPKFNCSFFGIR